MVWACDTPARMLFTRSTAACSSVDSAEITSVESGVLSES
jgi:hypothetical protein